MKTLTSSLAIQSWCFREFKTSQKLIKGLKDSGVSAVELCGVHVDFSKRESFKDVVQLYHDNGIEIVAIGVISVGDGADVLRLHSEFVRAAGAKYMNVTNSPEAGLDGWMLAAKIAEEFDLHYAIHNHGGHDWLGSSRALDYALKNCSDRIGLCLDTGWALASGEDPIQLLERFKDRVYGMHLKDFTFDRAGRPTDEVLGIGNIDLLRLIKACQGLPRLGFATIEYEGEPENPVPALSKCVQAVRSLL